MTCRSSSLYKRLNTSSLTYRAVHETVIWRVLHIHQLVLGASLKVSVGHHEARPVLVHGHFDGCVVLLAQVVPSSPEVRHGQPAGPQRTRATDPVTLALQLHKALHCLQQRSKLTGC